MNKKIIIIFISVLLMTGCSVEYNLDISNEIIKENVLFYQESTDNYSESYLLSEYNSEYPIFYSEEFLYYDPTSKINGNTYYEKSKETIDDMLKANYKATYNYSEYKDSRLLNTAFKNHVVINDLDTGQYSILASDFLLYQSNNNLNNVKIKINLNDYEVIENNADSVNNNIYTWNITKNNNKNISLIFKEKNTDYDDDNKEILPKKNNTTFINIYAIIFPLSFILVIGIGYLFLKNAKEKNNKLDD